MCANEGETSRRAANRSIDRGVPLAVCTPNGAFLIFTILSSQTNAADHRDQCRRTYQGLAAVLHVLEPRGGLSPLDEVHHDGRALEVARAQARRGLVGMGVRRMGRKEKG